jgi:histidine triad (HIT) family protein
MSQNETIFHKIVAGTAAAFVIAEDDDHLAFLDIFPFQKGQTVIVPKIFQPSKFSELETQALEKIMRFAQAVAKNMEAKLPDIARVLVVIEGLEIEYFHVKLIPTYSPYKGVPTEGKRADDEELLRLQTILRD